MEKLLEQMNSNYLLEPHTNLHDEAIEWLSDVEFCKTELSFLTKLLDMAFLRALTKKKINELSALNKKVQSFSLKKLNELYKLIVQHEQHLASLDENSFLLYATAITEEHDGIESDVKAFMENERKIKKEIFDFVEEQLRESKKIERDFEDGTMVL